MKNLWIVVAALLAFHTTAVAEDSPRIAVIDSSTATEVLLAKPGTYLGQKITFKQEHSGDVLVQVGVWGAGVGKSIIENFPFTEYVLMISGSVIVTENDGIPREFVAGDTEPRSATLRIPTRLNSS